ncbi:MAG TPA: bifunctional ADP-heptose synthase [Candidatus Acidoferrales bacterium]|jgi:D-beta-D-heptose 7-phosphate kinase/D-beta-D-heptose 1-phosphate adenosyltransferase|nr:bifunctional ADP-heptose synthase [Candidatus Acidoferrales bacterium]
MTIDAGKLTRFAKALRGRRIGVAGDFMLDRYITGSAARLSPEAPVPVVSFEKENAVLGGAGNVARNLAALGAKVLPFGVVGKDAAGDAIRDLFAAEGMAVKGVVTDASRITTEKTRIVAKHQQIVRVDRERREPLSRAIEDRLVRAIKAALPKLDALVISDYAKGVVTDALADRILTECKRRRVPALVKPKESRLIAYRGAVLIVCNAKEARYFVPAILEIDDSIEPTGRALLAHFGCSIVVITRGAEGLNVFDGTSPKSFHVPATNSEISYSRVGQAGVDRSAHGRQVFDVTGAGDTVLSVLALAMAGRVPIREAAVLANAGAGVVVGKLGTSTVTMEELLAAVRELL